MKYDGLIAYWRMNGNANDVSGNGYHGAVTGATLTTGKDGIADTAYAFNGSSDYITLGDIGMNSQQSRTLAAWVYLDSSWSAAGNVIGGRRGDRTSFAITSTRYLECREDDEQVIGAIQIQTETWTHIVYTFEYNGIGATDCTQRCYVNGVADTSRVISNYQDVWNVTGTWIGWESRFDYYFNGKISDVMWFNTNIDIKQVKLLHEDTITKFVK